MSTDCVGREVELGKLSAALREAVAGQSKVVFVAGGAGAGKSRLIEAFAAGTEAEVAIAVGGCDSQFGIGDPYLPFLAVLQELTGAVEEKNAKSSAHVRSRLRKFAGLTTDLLLEYAPDLLGTLIPGSSLIVGVARTVADKAGLLEKLKERFDTAEEGTKAIDQGKIMESYTALIRQLSARVPLVLVIEDLHWVDAASCALLFHLAQHLGDARVLIIGTFRANDVALGRGDERHPFTPVLNELKRYRGDIVIDLDAVDEPRRRAFVSAVADAEPNDFDDGFREALFRHTGGHALFTVELLRALEERGCITRGENGRLRITETLDWDVLPSRAEGVVEERIGRLKDELRELLYAASVEGESFTVEILARLNEISERALLKMLSAELEKRHQLVSEGDVEKIGANWISHYNFAHALFRQYLYNRLGRREKMMLHGSVAAILEELYERQLDRVTVQLAHHYRMAGEVQKAFEYSMRAARRALRIGACSEALTHTAAALGIVADLPPGEREAAEMDVQLLRGHTWQVLQGWDGPDTIAAYDRVVALAAELPANPATTTVLTTATIFGLLAQKLMRLELVEAEALATDLLATAVKLDLRDARVHAHEVLCSTYYWRGDFQRVLEHSQRMLDLIEPSDVPRFLEQEGKDPRALVLFLRVLAKMILGDFAAAQADQQLLQSVISATGHPYSMAIAQAISYNAAYVSGDAATTLAEARRGLDLTRSGDSLFFRSLPLLYMTWAEVKLGDPEGPAKISDAFRRLNANGGMILQSTQAMMLADAWMMRGAWPEALDAIDTGIAFSDARGEHAFIAEMHRTRGEVLRAAGHVDEARASYETAIEHARRQGARFFEQRAAESLAALSVPDEPL